MIPVPLPKISILADILPSFSHQFSNVPNSPFFFPRLNSQVFMQEERDGGSNFSTESLCEINNNQSAMGRGELIYNVLQPCMTFPLSMCQVFFTRVDTEG